MALFHSIWTILLEQEFQNSHMESIATVITMHRTTNIGRDPLPFMLTLMGSNGYRTASMLSCRRSGSQISSPSSTHLFIGRTPKYLKPRNFANHIFIYRRIEMISSTSQIRFGVTGAPNSRNGQTSTMVRLLTRVASAPPEMYTSTDMYSTLCHIEADTSALAMKLKAQTRRGSRKTYYQMDYDIVLSFGLTELKAQISWKENVGGIFMMANSY